MRRSTTVRTPYSTAARHPASDSCRMLSARTISPKRVSPPSVVPCPPRSRTLRQPSQSRSRLRGNGGALRALKRLRRCSLDEHADKLSGLGGSAEVDRRVAPRTSTEQRRVCSRRPLDENFLEATDALLVPSVSDALRDLDEPFDALVLHLVRDLVPGRGRFGARARRVDERVRAVKADLLDDVQGLAELVLRLARKADDDVGRERQVGDRCAQIVDE